MFSCEFCEIFKNTIFDRSAPGDYFFPISVRSILLQFVYYHLLSFTHVTMDKSHYANKPFTEDIKIEKY